MARRKQADGLNWTLQALDCYKRNSKCKGCIIPTIISSKCQMKESIKKILKEVGPPIPELLIFSKVTENQVDIIKAIKDGCKTKEELAKHLNLPIDKMQGRLRALYRLAQDNGCSFSDKKKNLETLIEFIKVKSEEIKNEFYL